MITTKQLLRGKPIKLNGVGTLVPPTLGQIFDIDNEDSVDDSNNNSVDKYLLYLNTLRVDLDSFLKMSGLEEAYNSLPDNQKQQCSLYKFMIAESRMRNVLLECFSFFIAEKVVFNEKGLCFDILSKNLRRKVGVINEDNFNIVRFNLLRLNCVSAPEMKPLKFASERARQIYEGCQKGKAALEKAKQTNKSDKKFNLENLVAYVVTKSHTYDFSNVWDMTIYQFYEEFYRTNFYNQLDTYTKRWATWGQDKFDFSTWYENIEILK